MKWIAALALTMTTGCENPSVGIGTSIGVGGASVTPVVAGSIGGVGVAVSP